MTLWTVAHAAPLSMGFTGQEYWNGLPFLSPGDLLNRGIDPESPTLQADSLLSEPLGKPESINIFMKEYWSIIFFFGGVFFWF